MIPKVIHYCWFGKGEKPELAIKCIESWKKWCPDYEIIEWNEENFDINAHRFCKEAYEAKKYAFVSDVVRLYAIFNYGGIYMDTDVEVIKSLDEFLKHQAFSGFETETSIPTGIMACEKNFKLFGEFLAYYDNRGFINEHGEFDMITNVKIMTEIMSKYKLELNNKFQIVEGFALYPQEFFCPLDNNTGKINKTKNTHAIHYFAKSWVDDKTRLRSKITRVFHRIFGVNCFKYFKR